MVTGGRQTPVTVFAERNTKQRAPKITTGGNNMAKSKKSTSKQKNLGQNRVNSNNNKSEETQHKTSKIERFFSGVNLGLSLIAIVISVLALFISWSQVDLEYRLNLPNLNMDVELFLNEDTNEEILKYQIINNGGNIREATIIPHMYLTYICSPDFGAEYESSYAIELNDFFAPHYKNGIYYSSVIPYNLAITRMTFPSTTVSGILKAKAQMLDAV
jgi:hypothetical protein